DVRATVGYRPGLLPTGLGDFANDQLAGRHAGDDVVSGQLRYDLSCDGRRFAVVENAVAVDVVEDRPPRQARLTAVLHAVAVQVVPLGPVNRAGNLLIAEIGANHRAAGGDIGLINAGPEFEIGPKDIVD